MDINLKLLVKQIRLLYPCQRTLERATSSIHAGSDDVQAHVDNVKTDMLYVLAGRIDRTAPFEKVFFRMRTHEARRVNYRKVVA